MVPRQQVLIPVQYQNGSISSSDYKLFVIDLCTIHWSAEDTLVAYAVDNTSSLALSNKVQ